MSSKPSVLNKESAQATLVGLLGMLAILPYRLQFHAGMNDEALLIQPARRMLEGQVPYRDFDLLYTPGSMAVTAGWMAIWGSTIEAARALMVLCGAMIVVLIFLIAKRILSPKFCYLPPLMFAVSGFSEWPVLGYHWFAILGLLVCLHQLLLWQDSGLERRLFFSGLGCGLSALCLQSEGTASCLAGLLLLASHPGAIRQRSRRCLLYLAGVAAIWLPFAGFLAMTGSLSAFVDNAILRVLGGLYKHHGAPYDLSKHVLANWANIASQWPTEWTWARLIWALESVSTVSVWTVKYALLFPVILGVAWLGYRRRGGEGALALFLILWVLVVRERLDLLYTNYLMPLWYIALIACLETLTKRQPRTGRAVLGFLLVLYASALLTALHYCSSFIYPIVTPGGRVWSRNPAEARAVQQVYRAAVELTPPGSRTFVWPNAASFYVLSRTNNPSRVDFLVAGWHTPEQAEDAAQCLREVDYIYQFPLDPTLLADYPNVDPKAFQHGNEEYAEIIRANFEPFAQAEGSTIYRRRSADGSGEP